MYGKNQAANISTEASFSIFSNRYDAQYKNYLSLQTAWTIWASSTES